ncbi:hypothetical protein AVEN_220224-1 [Araneus ventricosus]|uniref:Uncharacterized protein n=1 Tax=Araneus ventricosus TaxID=182803 RepID=A0A4Y2JGY5_ARAVE|nr:hypothetical protein AVEN_220224-1 [Araneus ventricosus]
MGESLKVLCLDISQKCREVGGVKRLFMGHEFSYEIKIVETDLVVGVREPWQDFSLQRIYREEMEDGGEEVTTDGISRGHELSYEIKIVEIGPVVEAG